MFAEGEMRVQSGTLKSLQSDNYHSEGDLQTEDAKVYLV